MNRSEIAAYQRVLIDIYKLSVGCADCGYSDHARALQFDHRPGTEKRGNIADMPGRYPTQTIMAEIIKCDVRCSNCHAIKTFLRRQ